MSTVSRRSLLVAGSLLGASLKLSRAGDSEAGLSRLASDPLRPQYHLLAPANWINDPNGPIYADGLYHLFYQYSADPLSTKAKEWGHAASSDMLHWRHWPIALSPAPTGWDSAGDWSGCAVLDQGVPTLIYTAWSPKGQVQALATSHDGMRSWQKLSEPIIDRPPPGIAAEGFRDPAVWQEPDGQWSMIIGSGDRSKGPMVLLYRSPDLRRWTYHGPLYEELASPYANPHGVADGMMWECPDFFPLGREHVLLTSGRGTRWAAGVYDGERFRPERYGLLDHGTSYAPRTMKDADGNRIMWTWLRETRGDPAILKAGWAGVISLPRVVEIGPDGDLAVRLLPEVATLRRDHRFAGKAELDAALKSWRIEALCGEVRIVARDSFLLRLRTDADEPVTEAGYDVDRDTVIAGPYHPPLRLGPDRRIEIRVLIDGSVIEIYVNDRVCVSLRSYPAKSDRLSLHIDNLAAVETLETWAYQPISTDRLTS